MPWEKRGRRKYYYKKRRTGDQVRSEYVGNSDLARLTAALDTLERTRRRWKQAGTDHFVDELEMLDTMLGAIGRVTDNLHSATLQATGFHYRRGEWRRRTTQSSTSKANEK